MRVAPLDKSLEPIFWEYVKRDVPNYFFFIYDWKYNRDETEVLLALEGDKIEGMMLIYRKSIVQLRGNRRAVEMLLEKLNLEKVELQAPEEYTQQIIRKYRPVMSQKLILMTLERGQENLQIKHLVVKLGVSDAERVAALMRSADPVYWGTVTAQQIVEGMKRASWFGIKVNGEIASIGSMLLTDWAGLIGVVATDKNYRRRGYATSVVSEIAKRILEKLPLAMIYVLGSNLPAIRVYEKVGFKQYRAYFFMKMGERR
ncbi:hypothetical protein DRO54_04075 [Candidatus Bathyarchaeota archaeon]|nr:MAG: hypothetical protein DRO54_04075 [Candidatus Bathyarchaeota archaeon]